jgi:hypothetical protein
MSQQDDITGVCLPTATWGLINEDGSVSAVTGVTALYGDGKG